MEQGPINLGLTALESLIGICRLGLDFLEGEATSECGNGRYEPCISPSCLITILEGH